MPDTPNPQVPDGPRAPLLGALLFLPLAAALLALDSRQWLALTGVDGQLLLDILLPLWLLWLWSVADRDLRLLMLMTLPISLVGELICSPLLDLYHYRHAGIPCYIPFGHAVVYGSCGLAASLPWAQRHRAAISRMVGIALGVLILGVGVVLGDTLTLGLGALLMAALYLRRWHHFYLIMAVMVLAIELLGTRFGCWAWSPHSLGVFRTLNPPVGAVAIYVIGDICVRWVATHGAALLHRAERPALQTVGSARWRPPESRATKGEPCTTRPRSPSTVTCWPD